jgi:hypothetical protein
VRSDATHIFDLWTAGGPFVGDDGAPHGRVTVDIDWKLRRTGKKVGRYTKGPVRWWQRADNSQVETEVPNVKTIDIDRSIETPAGTCTIILANQRMDPNASEREPLSSDLGNPGYYTAQRGSNRDGQARWGHLENPWTNVLVPNALLRTYQGYGGRDKTLAEARADGNLLLTGVWLIDDVRVTSRGELTLECRDMAKLLIEQQIYPPLVPPDKYPLRYCRWRYEDRVKKIPPQQSPRRISYRTSTNDYWYGHNAPLHGHYPAQAVDGNPHTFWLSVGNSHPSRPFCTDYIEFDVNEPINALNIHPWAGNYTVWISVMENGQWVDGGGGVIPYEISELCATQRCYETGASIPFVTKAGVPWETATTYQLPRTFNAQRVRLTFRDHTRSPWGPYFYRVGVRNVTPLFTRKGSTKRWTEKLPGNYKDYTDIVKDLLLWSGFFFRELPFPANGMPKVYGNIESTGIFAEECLDEGKFDKRPVIDAINELKEIVGFIFYIDDEGGAHFESPNWWEAGNFELDGSHSRFVPEIDERLQMTEYVSNYSDKGLRSQIMITTEDPETSDFATTVTTQYVPPTAGLLRGMQRPFMWVNGVFTNRKEQRIMAELVAMHIFFQQRQGQVTCAANPAISINDQVRILERYSSETFMHYVRGVTTSMDLQTGQYTMSLTTHWLGTSRNDWVITKKQIPTGDITWAASRFPLSADLQEYLERTESRALRVARMREPLVTRLRQVMTAKDKGSTADDGTTGAADGLP